MWGSHFSSAKRLVEKNCRLTIRKSHVWIYQSQFSKNHLPAHWISVRFGRLEWETPQDFPPQKTPHRSGGRRFIRGVGRCRVKTFVLKIHRKKHSNFCLFFFVLPIFKCLSFFLFFYLNKASRIWIMGIFVETAIRLWWIYCWPGHSCPKMKWTGWFGHSGIFEGDLAFRLPG